MGDRTYDLRNADTDADADVDMDVTMHAHMHIHISIYYPILYIYCCCCMCVLCVCVYDPLYACMSAYPHACILTRGGDICTPSLSRVRRTDHSARELSLFLFSPVSVC